MLARAVLAATALLGLVSAQNYSTSGPLSIVPSSVSMTLRNSWCTGEHNTCDQLCDGQPANNTCIAETLVWNCTCGGGPTPNISDYAASMPSYICQQWIADCTEGHPNDAAGQQQCQAVTCGMKNASSSGTSSSSAAASMTTAMSSASSAAASSTSGGSSSTTSAAAASTSSHSGAAAALAIGADYGTGILAGGMLAFFGFLL